jgi:glutaredoxin
VWIARGCDMAKVSVTLDDQQQAELKMILIDKDSEAALRFLKEIIWEQIQSALRKGLRSHLEKGAM